MSELKIMTKAMIKEKKDIAIAIAGGFIAGIGGIGLFAASGYMISQAAFAPPLYTLIVLTSLVKILGLLRAISRYGERLFSHRATFSMLSRLRVSFFSKLIPLTPKIFHKHKSGDLLSRIVGDVESLQNYFLRVAYPPLILVMVFLATIIFTSFFSIWVACLFVVGMLLAAFVVPSLVLLGQRKIYRQVRLQRAALSTELTEMMYGFRDLKVYGQMDKREQQLHDASAALADAQKTSGMNLLMGQSLHAYITHLVSLGVLGLGAFFIANGTLAGVFLAMLVMVSLTMFEEAAAVATLPAYKKDSEHAASRLADTVKEEETTTVQTNEVSLHDAAPSLEFCNVAFQHENDWRPAMRNVTFHLPAGSKTAIVGPSGAGKTTIFDLLLKLHTSTYGQVKINDIPVENLKEEIIWNLANVVLQHNHFFQGSIRDNLLLSGESLSDAELSEMLGKVMLDYKSLDDPVFEKGENLSDGEKQRLALARAMLKGGRLWLLDEPTASLDVLTEQRIFYHLFAQAKHDTLLLIRHRLTGLEKMDQIIVVEQGKVIESGTFKELMEKKGYLYEMKQIEQEVIGDSES